MISQSWINPSVTMPISWQINDESSIANQRTNEKFHLMKTLKKYIIILNQPITSVLFHPYVIHGKNKISPEYVIVFILFKSYHPGIFLSFYLNGSLKSLNEKTQSLLSCPIAFNSSEQFFHCQEPILEFPRTILFWSEAP